MKRIVLLIVIVVLCITAQALANKPNILWIMAEDTSPWMGCYGDKINAAATPNIDTLAASGVRFARAFVPAPVCSPCRSALIAGQSQIRFGAHEHRSSRGPVKIKLGSGGRRRTGMPFRTGLVSAAQPVSRALASSAKIPSSAARAGPSALRPS